MVDIKISVDSRFAAVRAALEKAPSQLDREVTKLGHDITDIAHRWAQHEAPRAKTGKLKASVQKTHLGGGSGLVFIANGIAPYADFVIDGTRPHDITPKGKKALFWAGAAHPWGKVHHPGTKSQPFMDWGYDKAQGEIERRAQAFNNWLGSLI